MYIPTSAFTSDAFPTDLPSIFLENGGPQDGGGSQLERWSSFIGIITAIAGNLLISFALNTQRYAHILIDREFNESRNSYANGHGPSYPDGYRVDMQEEIAEERRRKNLEIPDGKGVADDDVAESAEDSVRRTLQPAFESRQSKYGREKEPSDDMERASYLKSPYWWLGLVLMITGEAGNFLAYGFAPASIVSPLGVVALISNCLIAPLMLKERFRKRDLCGVLVAIAGAVTVVLSARTSEEKLGPGELWQAIKRWEFLLYVVITLALTIALMYGESRWGRQTILVDLGLVGLFGGYTVLSTKGVASLLSGSLYKAFAYPIFYFSAAILIVSALMQIRYLNRALQNYDSTQVIPTQFVLFTISVIIGSAILYRDFEHTTLDQAVKFTVGCLLTFFGVYLITSQRDEGGDGESHDPDDEETIQLLDEEAEDVDERTPLKRDAEQLTTRVRDEHPMISDQGEVPDEFATPRQPLRASSSIPSIAVTPAQSTEDLTDSNPWLASAEQIDAPLPQRTPRISKLQDGSSSTPFFTPATSRPLDRTTSSPADPETPSKHSTPRPPSPDRLAAAIPDDPVPSPTFLPRSARGSISRLIPVPGPLLPPLSSSLSALIADSLLKGEGAPRSVRSTIRRSRSGRHSTEDYRRQTTSVAEGDQPLGLHFQNHSTDGDLSRSQTHDNPPTETEDADPEDPDFAKRKTRLRALSESLSGVMGRAQKHRGNGKQRDDSDAPSAEDDGRLP